MRGCLAGYLLVSSLSLAQTWPQVRLVKVAGGFAQPTHIADAGDGSGRLFVVEQQGRIRLLKNGSVSTFLDITPRVGCCGERGLLSVAFPPGFASKRYFYVYYTDTAGDVNLARFRLGNSPDAADPASGAVLLTISHRQFANHNGGQLAFGPDGFLYMGTGDGGGGGDTLGNGQNTNALLGKLLRLDVEGGAPPYGIPPSNPFVNAPGHRPEIWAYGLRNPWRFSFDRTTGDLYIADVGQALYEEIDFAPAGDKGGENYGWNIMEGLHCYLGGCNTAGLALPVAEYPHDRGDCSVTGGFVYRGARSPGLAGIYFYSDACTGRLRGLRNSGGQWQTTVLLEPGFGITTFGQDVAGELYAADYGGGNIYMLAGAGPQVSAAGVVNAASYQAGLVPGSLATIFGTGLTTASGVVQAGTAPLPTSLNGTSVLVNGTAAPLLAVAAVNGQEQVNFQVPFEAAPGAAQIVVRNNGADGAAASVNVLAAQPGIFTTDGAHAAALHADFSPVNAASPARRGEVILVFATGLGAVVNPPATGALAAASPPATTVAQPQVIIGGRPGDTMFSGLAPQTAGEFQINVRVPADAPSGDQDLVVVMGGNQSPAVKLAVSP